MAALRIARYALQSNLWKGAFVVAALLVSCAGRSAFAQDCCPEVSPKILVLRGVFEVFSLGMNDLAHKLRCRGYDATSTSWSLALFATDCSGDRPLIVIGHSLGGRMCGWTSRLLKTCGQRVPLVIVVDANLLTPIPSNVDECLNLYVTNELGIFHGSPVYAESPHTQIINWDVSRGQPSMFRGGVNHFDIDATDWVHEIIIRQIECRFPLCPAMEEDTCEPVAARDRRVPLGTSNRLRDCSQITWVPGWQAKRSPQFPSTSNTELTFEPSLTGSNAGLSVETVAVQAEFGAQVTGQLNAKSDGNGNAGSADERRLVRPAATPLVHLLHDQEDPFDVDARRNQRVRWQPTRPVRTEVANVAESIGLIERVTWQPTVPARTEAVSADRSTDHRERVLWQPSRPGAVSTQSGP